MEERRDLVIVNIYKLLKLTKDGYNRGKFDTQDYKGGFK